LIICNLKAELKLTSDVLETVNRSAFVQIHETANKRIDMKLSNKNSVIVLPVRHVISF